MSLDTTVHLIYGYKTDGNKLQEDISKYTSEDKNWVLPNGIDIDEFNDNLNESSDGLCFVDDWMCGEYCYLGLSLMRKYDEYGEDWYEELDLNELRKKCDDAKLDEEIQKKIPFIVGNEYDVAGLLYGELPKLYLVKRVY